MEPFTRHTGRCLVLRRDNVDTDQIIPAEFCKRLTKTGYADALFAHWRKDPDFMLNDPRRVGASVLVAGANFGTGSSREHAVWALRDWGFTVVIASGFGDIFLRNAWKNGLLAVALAIEVVSELAELADRDPAFEITADLVECEVRAAGRTWRFEGDHNARWLLLNGLDDVDVTLRQQAAIDVYEKQRRHWLPRLAPGAVTARTSERAEVP